MSKHIEKRSHHTASEMAALGCVLLHAETYWAIAEVLRGPEDFYLESHRHIWRAMGKVIREPGAVVTYTIDLGPRQPLMPGRGLDVITLADELGRQGLLDACGGVPYLSSLASNAPMSTNASSYAKRVVDHAITRQLKIITQRAPDFIDHPVVDGEVVGPHEVAQTIVSQILEVTATTKARGMTPGDLFGEFWAEWEQAGESGSGGLGDLCNIAPIDTLLGGIHTGRSIYLAMLPKHGKSTLTAAIALNLAVARGWAVDFWSVETSEKDQLSRAVSYLSGVDRRRHEWARRKGQDVAADIAAMKHAEGMLRGADIRWMIDGRPDVTEIATITRARRARLPGDKKLLLVVDYLQNCTAKGYSDPTARAAEVSMTLNGLTKSLSKVTGLFPLQFNKTQEVRFYENGQAPVASGFKGTSQYLADGNHVLIGHRPCMQDVGSDGQRYMSLTQVAGRHGRVGELAHLEVDLERGQFTPWRSADYPDRPIPVNPASRGSRSPERGGRYGH